LSGFVGLNVGKFWLKSVSVQAVLIHVTQTKMWR